MTYMKKVQRMEHLLILRCLIILFWLFLHKIIDCAKILSASTCTQYPCLIFEDTFDTLDFFTWKHMQSSAETGNQEFQYYTNNRTNSYVKDGVLYIKPTLTSESFGGDSFLTSGTLDLWTGGVDVCTSNRGNYGCFRKGSEEEIINPIQSASITTQESFVFKYGKMEVQAKLPIGDWLWPAIWLMPKHSEYGNWPASGEIDLMESRGNLDLTRDDKQTLVGVQRVEQSLHWGPYNKINGQSLTIAKTNKERGTFADKFHTFSFVWNSESLIFYINGKLTLNVTLNDKSFWDFGNFQSLNYVENPWRGGTKFAPFDKEFYIIMNLAVGGTNNYFHPNYIPKAPWNNDDGLKAMTSFWESRDKWLPTWKDEESALKIDYVKVWKLEKDPF